MAFNKYTRFISPARKTKDSDELAIIIPAAGAGYRMKSHGPKCLLNFRNTSILERQLGILHNIYPQAQMIVVVGFQADNIYKCIQNDRVRFIENERYDDTNVVHSIGLGIRAATEANIAIVYGDLIFNSIAIKNLSGNESFIITENSAYMNSTEIGVTIEQNKICHFAYSLVPKWGQVLYIAHKDKLLFKSLVCDRNNERLYGFEILNQMLDNGTPLEQRSHASMIIMDIDEIKDLDRALQIKELQ